MKASIADNVIAAPEGARVSAALAACLKRRALMRIGRWRDTNRRWS